jgi:polyisoprenoid-binding protein YceI
VNQPCQRALAIATLLIMLMPFAATPQLARGTLADNDGADSVQLDPARSRVGFRVRLMWLLSIGGHFGKVQGNVQLDRFRSQVSVDATIDVNAVSMNNQSAEDWVKSAEFFDAAHHSQIEFASEPFPQSRLREGGDIAGVLTLRGIRQPVHFELQPAVCDRPAFDCPIEVEGVIRRSAFGMRSRHGTLSDRVELRLSVYATAPPSPSNP